MKYFTIFGNPVSHSLSPYMHNLALNGLGQDGVYSRYKLEDGTKLRETFFKLGISGANITVPHKEIAYQICDEIRGVARDIKTVNTIVRYGDKLIGYNTDASGFYQSIKNSHIKKAIILGAGGTAKALSFYLRERGIEIIIINRSENRLDYFKKRNFKTFSWQEFKMEDNIQSDLVINTTSAGLEDKNLPAPQDLMKSLFENTKQVIDVIYNINTPFLQLAKKFNLPNKDGKEMLLYQGVIAFNHFFNNIFEIENITKEMKKAFV